MYISMLGEIIISELGYIIVIFVIIAVIFYIVYLTLGDDIATDEDDDIDLWPK